MTTLQSNLVPMLRKIDDTLRDVHQSVVALAEDSIVFGSPLTGSSGQPEDLRHGEFTVKRDGELDATIGSDEKSVNAVETGISRFNGHPIKLRSPVGGFHSVALTHQNIGTIVEEAVRRLAPSA